FTYDSANRLSGVSATGSGCPASATYTYDNGASPAGDGNMSGWSYDAQDRLTTGWTYTSNGEAKDQTVGSIIYSFYYDVLGNLRRWWSHNASGTFRTQDYKIDGLNRRIARVTNGKLEDGWLFDGDRIIGEVDSTGALLSHFLYLTKPNVPDLMLQKVN